MSKSEAVRYLRIILNDTLDWKDEHDAKRIEAVKKGIAVLQGK